MITMNYAQVVKDTIEKYEKLDEELNNAFNYIIKEQNTISLKKLKELLKYIEQQYIENKYIIIEDTHWLQIGNAIENNSERLDLDEEKETI